MRRRSMPLSNRRAIEENLLVRRRNRRPRRTNLRSKAKCREESNNKMHIDAMDLFLQTSRSELPTGLCNRTTFVHTISLEAAALARPTCTSTSFMPPIPCPCNFTAENNTFTWQVVEHSFHLFQARPTPAAQNAHYHRDSIVHCPFANLQFVFARRRGHCGGGHRRRDRACAAGLRFALLRLWLVLLCSFRLRNALRLNRLHDHFRHSGLQL